VPATQQVPAGGRSELNRSNARIVQLCEKLLHVPESEQTSSSEVTVSAEGFRIVRSMGLWGGSEHTEG